MRIRVSIGLKTFGIIDCEGVEEAKRRLDLASCEEAGDDLCRKRSPNHGHIRPRYYAARAHVMEAGAKYRKATLLEIGEVLCLVVRGTINTAVDLTPVEGGDPDLQ